jgi:hypothetical protein
MLNRILSLIDRIAGTWLDWRTEQVVRSSTINLGIKKVEVGHDGLEMVLMGPAVFTFAEQCAAILNQQNAENYVETHIQPRLDRGLRPIRLTIH